MYISFVVSCPHFTAAVAHGHQVIVQLEGLDRDIFNLQICGKTREIEHELYPKSLQGFACPAVIHGHGAVSAPREDVLVISSQANDGFTVGTKAFHQRFSSFEHKKVTISRPDTKA